MNGRYTDSLLHSFWNSYQLGGQRFRPGQHQMVCGFPLAFCTADFPNLELQVGSCSFSELFIHRVLLPDWMFRLYATTGLLDLGVYG